jgi:hypothetical protein
LGKKLLPSVIRPFLIPGNVEKALKYKEYKLYKIVRWLVGRRLFYEDTGSETGEGAKRNGEEAARS